MNIAITGATGQLGRLVLNMLIQQSTPYRIIALARSPQKAANLEVEVRHADYDKPETLAGALQGVNRLLLISGNEVGKRAEQHRRVIESAQKAGIEWIVYTSLLHADTSSLSLAPEHLATETLLKQSGLPFTLLRNGWYTENYTGSIPGALKSGVLLGSAGDGKIAAATRADFAEAAAAVLTGDGHIGKTYELAGDEAFTLSELAAEISHQTGGNIPYKNLPEAEYAATLQRFGLHSGLARAIAGWDAAAAKGDLFDDSGQLSSLIGRPTTSWRDTVTAALNETS
ncbi:NAD(P)H dehydrogenase (quinone) [Parapedobacter composti]|uniref:NAD(P)H dehydrogenase (Quinone) n=1 Tax=Parapedobacter composti TaxID=623281 RepID=A0A1I1JUG8_9SPHI|nr:SDR family oxidoreductase [Parapedobacter composti]SFC52309.1 NAD(P)H dehydrogenase (quinone) [Parapedobacter composti]